MMKRTASVLLSLLLCLCLTTSCLAEAQTVASTEMYDDSSSIVTNIDLAIDALDGATIKCYKVFSFNDAVGPRTAAKGYKAALNGRGVKVMGGGVAQVATSLYLSLKDMDGVSFPEKRSYGNKFAWSYVDSNKDAIVVDYRAGTDFRILNKTESDLRIAMRREAEILYCMVYPVDSGDIEKPDTSDVPVVDPDDPDDEPDDEPVVEAAKLCKAYRCQEYVNLRKKASTSSESIARIPLGATVLILNTNSKLYKAKYNGLTGYVNKNYVKAVSQSLVRKVVRCKVYVSLREEPSESSVRLKKLPLGTLVEYVENAGSGYAKVHYENLTEYVMINYLAMLD